MTPIQQLMLGAGGKALPTYMDDVFSSYVRTYTGASATINNGIDFSEGGLVWAKNRTQNYNHVLIDTLRGGNKVVKSTTNTGEETASDLITAFNNNGYTVGADASFGSLNNSTTDKGVHWSFRKAPGFFDVVTFTETNSTLTVNHNVGCRPGMVMIKRTDAANDWWVWHNYDVNKIFRLNTSAAGQSMGSDWLSVTSTTFNFIPGYIGAGNGSTWVA